MAMNGDATDGPHLRRGLLARTMFTVLRQAGSPRAAGEVLDEVAETLTLNAEETRKHEHSGAYRYRSFLHRVSSWAHRVGWLIKDDGRWELTVAGVSAIGAIQDDTELLRVVNRAYRQVRSITTVLDPVDEGSWTGLSDVAAVAKIAADRVEEYLGTGGVVNAHRVLADDGTPRGHGASATAQREQLAEEGIEFDAAGKATPGQRVTIEELRDGPAEVQGDGAPGKRAWLVRGSSVDGYNLVPQWLTEGWVSLAATNLRALELPVSHGQLTEVVATDYQHKAYAVRQSKIAEFHAFLNQMSPGDLVLTTTGGRIYGGTIDDAASQHVSEDGHSNLRREVSWHNPGAPIAFAELPEPLPAKLSSQSDVVDLTEALATIERLLEVDDQDTPPPRELVLPDATDALAGSLYLDRQWLQELIDVLRDRRQVILYGPPGTGKTYLAQRLAEHLTETHAYKLVQFHPSYSYEDFFEGYRPSQNDDGTLSFELRPGPLRRIVEVARDDPATPYILIIDEINRANLAKVFGELYFLLEYRDRSIDLLYSTEETEFTLPPNVLLIGTMNTADRSIALVDAAMRRRFAFLRLHPAEPPVRGLLARWLAAAGLGDEAALLLEELNQRIDDPDFAIGPSYFMRPDVHRPGGLERMWRTDILPLLEEHHYGDAVEVDERYDLARLRRSVAAAPGEQPPEESSGQSADDAAGQEPE